MLHVPGRQSWQFGRGSQSRKLWRQRILTTTEAWEQFEETEEHAESIRWSRIVFSGLLIDMMNSLFQNQNAKSTEWGMQVQDRLLRHGTSNTSDDQPLVAIFQPTSLARSQMMKMSEMK